MPERPVVRPLPRGRLRVFVPQDSRTIKRAYKHISQSVCPWNVQFSQALADVSPFRTREFLAGKDTLTLRGIF